MKPPLIALVEVPVDLGSGPGSGGRPASVTQSLPEPDSSSSEEEEDDDDDESSASSCLAEEHHLASGIV